ncbi:MAG: HNH endonuclease domain-containing protein, partial [Methanomicrobiales archaeon]
GYSQAKEPYSVYTYRKNEGRVASSETIDRDFLVQNFGEFSISTELNTVFRYFGGFISGENTLLLKWATLSSKKSNGLISVAEVMEVLQEAPETERDTQEAQRFYKHLWDIKEDVVCVWTGHKINSLAGCNIDHVLPFMIWKNNELWNLMPALPDVNGKKSDNIPSGKLLEARKEAILHYWDLMLMWKDQQNPFEKEIRISLTGKPFDPALWKQHAFEALKTKCKDLIEIRGFTEWDL